MVRNLNFLRSVCNLAFMYHLWYVRPAKAQINLRIHTVEHHLMFLSLKGGCTGSSESALVNMPHCWKSHQGIFIYYNSVFGCIEPNTD